MSNRSSQGILDLRTVLDSLGQGVLLFDTDGQLVYNNHAAQKVLGANLVVLRAQGWDACTELFDAKRGDAPSVAELRSQAFQAAEPIHFGVQLAGVHVSCWVTAVYDPSGQVYTMITLERPDWTAFGELMSHFRHESGEAISGARGHAELILKILRQMGKGLTAEQMSNRISGFAGAIATQMQRLEQLTTALFRLEVIRTDQLRDQIHHHRASPVLEGFIEDYLEELSERGAIDPTFTDDFRARLTLDIPDDLTVTVSPPHFRNILTDVLRNAVMYSPSDAPILIRASRTAHGRSAQLEIVDQGCGIRDKEAERVFAPFQRARQPQVLGEFGYGISLYLCKIEIEAMGGKIWYTSEEKVGTTFYLKLPL